jgi:PAS domain S-box-containing protein
MPRVALVHPDAPEREQLAAAIAAAGMQACGVPDVASLEECPEALRAIVIGRSGQGPRLAASCRLLRAGRAGADVPILAFANTGGDPSERIEVLQAGADVFLRGPIEASELVAQLSALLRLGRGWVHASEAERIRGQLEAVFNAMGDGVTVFDATGRVILLNEAQARINGFASTADMMQGLEFYARVYELTTPEGRLLPVAEWPVSRVMRGESLSRLELRALRRDTGQSWHLEYSGQPVRGADGRQILSVIVNRDITREKVIEERMIEAKEIAERHRVEQEAIFNSMTEGLVVFDPHGNLLDMNPAALAIHRFKSVTAVRMHIGELPALNTLCGLDGTPLPLEAWPISRALRGEVFHDYEVLVRPTGGGEPWIGNYGGAPVIGPDGTMMLAIVTLRDVTAQKRAAEELRQKEAALARANAELEQKVAARTAQLRETIADLEHFSYTLTHDLRAPLRAMHAFGDVLQQRHAAALDPVGRDYLRRVVQSAGRMDALITDALDYSKVMRSEYALQPVEPAPLLRGIVDSYPELQPPQAQIELPDLLPPVRANRAGLTQCFANLLTNAVKFVGPGVAPRVRITAEERGDRVRLWFEDNGIGVPPEQRERIFGMFERLSPAYPGTGVGLALVRKVAERMDGRVGVEAGAGGGSRFWLEFAKPGAPASIASEP